MLWSAFAEVIRKDNMISKRQKANVETAALWIRQDHVANKILTNLIRVGLLPSSAIEFTINLVYSARLVKLD